MKNLLFFAITTLLVLCSNESQAQNYYESYDKYIPEGIVTYGNYATHYYGDGIILVGTMQNGAYVWDEQHVEFNKLHRAMSKISQTVREVATIVVGGKIIWNIVTNNGYYTYNPYTDVCMYYDNNPYRYSCGAWDYLYTSLTFRHRYGDYHNRYYHQRYNNRRSSYCGYYSSTGRYHGHSNSDYYLSLSTGNSNYGHGYSSRSSSYSNGNSGRISSARPSYNTNATSQSDYYLNQSTGNSNSTNRPVTGGSNRPTGNSTNRPVTGGSNSGSGSSNGRPLTGDNSNGGSMSDYYQGLATGNTSNGNRPVTGGSNTGGGRQSLDQYGNPTTGNSRPVANQVGSNNSTSRSNSSVTPSSSSRGGSSSVAPSSSSRRSSSVSQSSSTTSRSSGTSSSLSSRGSSSRR